MKLEAKNKGLVFILLKVEHTFYPNIKTKSEYQVIFFVDKEDNDIKVDCIDCMELEVTAFNKTYSSREDIEMVTKFTGLDVMSSIEMLIGEEIEKVGIEKFIEKYSDFKAK